MFLNMFGQVNAIGETEILVGPELEECDPALRTAVAEFPSPSGRGEAGMWFFVSQTRGFA